MRPQRLNNGFDFIRGQPVCLPYPAEGYFLLVQHGGKRSSNAEFVLNARRRGFFEVMS